VVADQLELLQGSRTLGVRSTCSGGVWVFDQSILTLIVYSLATVGCEGNW